MPYSRFYLTDLQVHTPADPQQGYGDWGGKEPNRAFAKKFIEQCVTRDLRVLAVTDHNRVDWFSVLREEGDKHGVFVFPGVEVSINRCHLVLVWDRTEEDLSLAEQFLATCWAPGAARFAGNGDPLPVGIGQVADVAERAIRHKALVFTPHATQKDIGFFAKGVCTNRDEVIKKNLIAGFDVYGNPGLGVLKSPQIDFSTLPVPWFISGDVRKFEDVGLRATFLKLGAVPTLEGLRQAFLMPETRIRFPETLRDTWGHVAGVRFLHDPSPTWPRITAVEVTGGFHDGLRFDLAPGLNAIIGGKGSGKSALIEIVRYTTEASPPIEKDLVDNRKVNFRANAEGRVSFVDAQGQAYVAVRVGNDTPAKLVSGAGATGVAVGRRFKLTVFGQRELRQLADGQTILRQFVASTSGAEWEAANAEEKQVRQQLDDANARLQQLEIAVSRLEEKEADLADLKEKLEQARKGGAEQLLQKGNALGSVDVKVQAALRWPVDVGAAAETLAGHLPRPEIPPGDGVPDAIGPLLEELAGTVQAASTTVRLDVERVSTAFIPLRTAWNQYVQASSAEITAALAALGISDAADLTKIQASAAHLEAELSSLGDQKQAQVTCEGERTKLLERLEELARQKSRIVEEAALALNKTLAGRVRLNVEPLADKTAVLEWIKKLVQGANVSGAQLEKLLVHPTPTIAQALKQDGAAVTALGVAPGTATKLLERFDSRRLREFEELATPDRITAEVNLGTSGGETWKPVTAVSPGQRATALLALVLLSSDEPLIIDQPEDDLDNQHIYEDIVRVLADVCQKRQVIVATHNANIPVLGDAELLVAVDADAQRSRVEAIGGFEDAGVASYARRILEGGEAAFRARQRRYSAPAPE
jgi:ABC-type lipoprotein export system ATPase subunit